MNKETVLVESCPICGKGNNCCNSKEKSLGECWCSGESFPKGIFDLVPPDLLRKKCICKECLDTYEKNAKF